MGSEERKLKTKTNQLETLESQLERNANIFTDRWLSRKHFENKKWQALVLNQKREVQRLLQSRSEHRVLFFITLEYFGWLYQPSPGLQISAEMAHAFRVFAKQLHVSHILFVSFFFFFLVFAVSTEECVDYMQSVTMLYMRQLYRKACNTRRFTFFFFRPLNLERNFWWIHKKIDNPNAQCLFFSDSRVSYCAIFDCLS